MRQGRFDQPASETAQLYGESVSVDWRLYPYDIKGSLAHAGALVAAGILTREEHEEIRAALTVIQAEIEAGDFRRCQKPRPAASRGWKGIYFASQGECIGKWHRRRLRVWSVPY